VDYYLEKPHYSVIECQEQGLTYAVQVKARLRLSTKPNAAAKEYNYTIENDVYLGNLPYMTPRGSFIINGAERAIVSQLHRSPGVVFSESIHANGTKLYSARVIPFRGSWVEFTTDINNLLYAYIDRKKKFYFSTLLRALGLTEHFGASLEVASEYTGRLAAMLVIMVAILWLTWWVMRALYEPLATRSARWLRHGIRWSRRHPVLGRLAGPVLYPSRGEVLSVSMMGILLVVIFWGLVMLLFLSPFAAQPRALDQAVHDIALSLRNHLADPVMIAISQLSRWPVTIFSALALFLWLMGAGRRNAAMHWLIAIGGGGLLHLLLSWSLRTTPQVFDLAGQSLQSPSAAMGLPTVVLTFFAVMEAGELTRKHRQWPYLVSALILIFLGVARLYLGLEWLSGALMGLVAGLAWTAIVGIAYRQRATRRFSGAAASLIFFGSLLALFSWQVKENLEKDLSVLDTYAVVQEISADIWWETGWKDLSSERTQLSSVASRSFNAQVAVDPATISELLEPAGWTMEPEADWRWIIQALNPEPRQASLPLLGRAYQGRSEVLLLSKDLEPEGRLLTIRLWDSGVRLEPGGQVLYLAQLSEEVLVQRLGLFSYWRSTSVDQSHFEPLRDPLRSLQQKRVGENLLLIR
jgi:hypothetical protein